MDTLAIGKVNVQAGQFVPPLLESVVAAALRGEPLVPCLQAIVASFGFDSFEYGVSASPHPDRSAVNSYFSTLPETWSKRYAERGYIEVDPRIFLTCHSAIPLVWDQTTIRRFRDPVNAFVDDARAHGIASGVCFMWHGPSDMGVVVALNSHFERNDEIRTKSIHRNLPDIVLLGHYFHEIFALPALSFGRQSSVPFKRLSKRERECLDLAARGMTTRDICAKLEISASTVQFHFEHIFAKLGAANRQEAVARGIQTGVVRGR